MTRMTPWPRPWGSSHADASKVFLLPLNSVHPLITMTDYYLFIYIDVEINSSHYCK